MNKLLNAYWITFPDNPRAPMGLGVTAYSKDDAWYLIVEKGYDEYLFQQVEIIEGIKFDELDETHIVQNMGPIIFRGIWYPCLNIGFGASGQR